MVGIISTAVILLLCAQSARMEGCSTEETRRAVVDDALANLGCDNYSCGKTVLF